MRCSDRGGRGLAQSSGTAGGEFQAKEDGEGAENSTNRNRSEVGKGQSARCVLGTERS